MAKTGKTPASSPSSSSSGSLSSGAVPPVTSSSTTMATAAPSKALALLGGSRRSTARSEDDIMKAVTSVKKEDRHKLSEEKRAKFHSYATKGMEDKFSLLVPSEGIEELSHVYSLALRVAKFQETLDSYDLSDVFNILPFQSDLSDIDEHGEVLNLLDSYRKIDLDHVLRSSRFYFTLGSEDYLVENLAWSGELLLNSCEKELRELIDDKALGFARSEKCGPVYFKIMMDIIFSDSDKSLRALVTRLQTMKLTDFAGENVMKASSFIRGSLKILRGCEFEPKDMDSLIVEFYKSSTNAELTNHMSVFASMMDAGLHDFTIDKVIMAAEKKYKTLTSTGQWEKLGEGDGKSVFAAQLERRGGGSRFDGECFNCGKYGHRASDCRSKKQNERHDTFGKKEKGAQARGNGQRHGQYAVDPSKIPPKISRGEPTTKSDGNGGTLYWCGHCSVWNTDHAQGSNDCPNKSKASKRTGHWNRRGRNKGGGAHHAGKSESGNKQSTPLTRTSDGQQNDGGGGTSGSAMRSPTAGLAMRLGPGGT